MSDHPKKKFIGTCSLCPFMKMITLENTLDCIRNENSSNYEITFPPHILEGATRAYKNTMDILENEKL